MAYCRRRSDDDLHLKGPSVCLAVQQHSMMEDVLPALTHTHTHTHTHTRLPLPPLLKSRGRTKTKSGQPSKYKVGQLVFIYTFIYTSYYYYHPRFYTLFIRLLLFSWHVHNVGLTKKLSSSAGIMMVTLRYVASAYMYTVQYMCCTVYV